MSTTAHPPPEARAASFAWPAPGGEQVTWLGGGRGFRVGERQLPVLSFLVERSGWSDDLTTMHEETAGENHPIDLASRGRALSELMRVLPREDATVLEVGCSSGYFLRDARAAFPRALIIGADYVGGPLATLAAAVPDQPLLQFDLTRCPLPDASVDAVVALNVLEHIEDDVAAVEQMFRILKPGGAAIIELPAGPALFDVYDKMLMHHRRYTRRGAVSLFRRAGFEVVRPTHIGFAVYPAFAAVKLSNKRHLGKSEAVQRAVVERNIASTGSSALMRIVMRTESAIGRWVKYPFGIRVAFSARKPATR